MNKLTEMDIKKYTFTTGAFITPVEINGKYFWVVSEFEDDTFCDGNLISPNISGDKVMDLINVEEIETWKCEDCGTDCSAITCPAWKVD